MLNSSRAIFQGLKGKKGTGSSTLKQTFSFSNKNDSNSFLFNKLSGISNSSIREISQKFVGKETNLKSNFHSSTFLFRNLFQNEKSSIRKASDQSHRYETREDVIYGEEFHPDEVGRLPHGLLSLLGPILFCLGVAGATIAAVNSDWAKENRRKRSIAYQQSNNNGVYGEVVRQFTETERMLMALMGANLAVFGAWQIPALQPMMYKYFTSSILHKNPISLLLSTFSHKGPGHFALNMIGLASLTLSLQNVLSRDQILAFYVAGGTSASLASNMFKLAMRDFAPSLGASGAVFGLLSATAYLNPDTRFAFIFLPFVSFTAKTLLPIAVGVDAIGAAATAAGIWRGLDHVAHLGGAAFGWLYTAFLVDKYKRRNQKAQK